jgi:hypothetical protein
VIVEECESFSAGQLDRVEIHHGSQRALKVLRNATDVITVVQFGRPAARSTTPETLAAREER